VAGACSSRPSHLPLEARAWGDVQLATHDRFDSSRLGFKVKLDRTMHVTVIGHCDRGLSELRCASNDLF
jgi:hypothetical protein